MMEHELARVLSHYALGELLTVQRIEHGFVNENWAVETTCGRYFLKRRQPDLGLPATRQAGRPELIRAQHELMAWLREASFPAPAVLPTVSGETFLLLDSVGDAEFYEIHDYIEAEPYDHDRPEHLEAAARILGRYHTCVEGFARQAFRDLGALYSPKTLNNILARLRATWQIDQQSHLMQMVREVEAQAANLAARFAGHAALLPHLVIHGDYYAGNLLFEDDRIVGVLDYDKARWRPRILELAEALIYFAAERPGYFRHIVYSGTLELGLAHQFLMAYSDVVSLSEVEIRVLPDWISTIWLCASLDPPLEPLMSPEAAPQALPEVLALADWVQAYGSDVVDIALTARKKQP